MSLTASCYTRQTPDGEIRWLDNPATQHVPFGSESARRTLWGSEVRRVRGRRAAQGVRAGGAPLAREPRRRRSDGRMRAEYLEDRLATLLELIEVAKAQPGGLGGVNIA